MRRLAPFLCALTILGLVATGGNPVGGQDRAATPATASAPGIKVDILAQREANRVTGSGLALYRVTFAPETAVAEHRLPGAFLLTVEAGSLLVAPRAGTIDVARPSATGAPQLVETIGAPGPDMIAVTGLNPGESLSADGPVVLSESSTNGEPTVILVATTFGPGEHPVQFVAAPPRRIATPPAMQGGVYQDSGVYHEVDVDAPGMYPDTDAGADAMSTPDVSIVPSAAAPAGLADVTLPADAAAIEALFDRFPPMLAGLPREPNPSILAPDDLGVAYGTWSGTDENCGQPAIGAAESGTGEAPAHLTAEHHVALVLGEDLPDRDDRIVAGHDGDLYWARADWREENDAAAVAELCSALVWGEAGSRWFFTAIAPTSEQLDALLAAFVAAAVLP